MSLQHHAIKFLVIDFGQNWSRTDPPGPDGVVEYKALEPNAPLSVVTDGSGFPGGFVTYNYMVGQHEIVWVVGQVVHIPKRCTTRLDGNAVICNQG